MAVVRVGQLQAADEMLVPRHEAQSRTARFMRSRVRSSALAGRSGRFATMARKHSSRILVGPPRAEEVRHGEAHEQVSQGDWIDKHTGIVQRDEWHGRTRSVLESELLRLGGQVIGQLLSAGVVDLFVRHEVPKEDPSPRANHPVGNALLVQELDQVGARDVQEGLRPAASSARHALARS